jgi:uncharacterized protein YjiS (DUF1127 family)
MRAIPWRGPAGAANRTRQTRERQLHDPLIHGLIAVRALLRTWRERRRGRAALASFDDRMLRDIGITRVEAHYEINKPFWRE